MILQRFVHLNRMYLESTLGLLFYILFTINMLGIIFTKKKFKNSYVKWYEGKRAYSSTVISVRFMGTRVTLTHEQFLKARN